MFLKCNNIVRKAIEYSYLEALKGDCMFEELKKINRKIDHSTTELIRINREISRLRAILNARCYNESMSKV